MSPPSTSTPTSEQENDKPIQEVLSLPILLTDRVLKSTQEAESFLPENSDLSRQLTILSHLLRSAARLTASPTPLYDRPLRCVTADLTKTLDRALILARKSRHRLRHVISITTAADFKKVSSLLDSSLADIKWVLSILDKDSDNGTMPPIASNDPVLAWVWAYLAAVQMGRAEAATELATLARDNDRTKKVIVEERGVPPLLRMLKESGNVEGQAASAFALCSLADNAKRVAVIVGAGGVPVIAKAMEKAAVRVRVSLVDLVSRMAEVDSNVKEDFGKENVTRPLVSLLGMDVDLEEFKEASLRKAVVDSLHSLVEINKEMAKVGLGSGNGCEGSRRKEKEKEVESPEVKLKLRVSCATALSILARGSLSNCRKITETKALLVLAKIIEKEQGELRVSCLMVVMELAVVAEFNDDLKRTAFKPNSPAAKAVLDQLLRVINEETSVPLVIPAIKAIGCLAKMFPAKETRIIKPLVTQLANRSMDVAGEAAKALGKFVCDDNFNRKEHSKAIIEFGGVPKLMNLLRSHNRGQVQVHELVLLCNLAVNVGNSKSLEQARALSVLEGAARHAVAQHPDLRELFVKAIHQLTLYQAGDHAHRQAVGT